MFDPFIEFAFMRRALVACLALAMGCAPVGVFIILRRMSLLGDALSHAILPGVAVAFVISGLSVMAMSLGGFVAGFIIVICSGFIARITAQREDASMAAFYLISLASGVLITSVYGNAIDLMHMLFGSILAVDNAALILLAVIATVTVFMFAIIYRPLVFDCFDAEYLNSMGWHGSVVHLLFMMLVVLNLVAGFQALGTLMAVGLMILPAASASFWAHNVLHLIFISFGMAMFASVVGLLLSYHIDLPSGPAIILTVGVMYVFSALFGWRGGALRRFYLPLHLER